MEPRFKWAWHTDDSGEHVRVIGYSDERPEGVEVCRLVPDRTADRTGCVMRAVQVCEAMTLLARTVAHRKIPTRLLEPSDVNGHPQRVRRFEDARTDRTLDEKGD